MSDKKKTVFSELQKTFLSEAEAESLAIDDGATNASNSAPSLLDVPILDFDSNEPKEILIATGTGMAGTASAVATATVCKSSASAMSDRRLKTNISPLSGALEKTLRLEGVEYDWRDKDKYGSRHQIGLIAQDIEQIFPEVVNTDPETGLKSVSYQLLVAPMIESIKELHARLSKLEGEIELKNSLLAAAEAELKQSPRQPLSS